MAFVKVKVTHSEFLWDSVLEDGILDDIIGDTMPPRRAVRLHIYTSSCTGGFTGVHEGKVREEDSPKLRVYSAFRLSLTVSRQKFSPNPYFTPKSTLRHYLYLLNNYL